jgi:hypothetical protein
VDEGVASLREAFEALTSGDPLAALKAAQDLRALLPSWESQLARQALAAGATWESIGQALGTSRQAAWERLRPGIARAIREERSRLQSERSRLKKEREKRWQTKTS